MRIFPSIRFSGNERSVNVKKHITYSFGLKGLSIVINLALVPLLLAYLSSERYGVWLTISSIVNWFSFFDIGLGNGLRNRFAEAKALNNDRLARIYVSTTYFFMLIISSSLILLALLIVPILNWQLILNTTLVSNNEIEKVVLILFIFFSLRFFLKLIGIILIADQKPAINNAFAPIANIITLIIIFFLSGIKNNSLIYTAWAFSLPIVFIYIIASVFFFSGRYRYYKPSLKFVEVRKIKDLISLGVKFFIFQISALVFFSASNFFIAQFSNQKMVTSYNIVYKYLFLFNMIYGIILFPFWSAVTDAYVKKDFVWLKEKLRKLNFLSAILSIGIILAVLISPYVYNLWIGDKVRIEFSLTVFVGIYLILQIFIAPFSTFINGFGKLGLGLRIVVFKIILYFFLIYFLGEKFGIYGIVVSMIIIQLPALILEPIQVFKILNQRDYGIWGK